MDPGYLQAGYLWLAADEGELAGCARRSGCSTPRDCTRRWRWRPEEVARLNPAIALDSVAGGVFCPTDGFIRPLSLLEGYLAAARRLGVRSEWGVEVTGVSRRPDGTISAVLTSSGPIGVARRGERGRSVGGGRGRAGPESTCR